MRNKVVLFLVAVMVVAGLVVGCAAPAPAPTPTPTPTPAPTPTPTPAPQKPFQWPSMLVAMGGGTTNPGYIIALSWTPLHEKDTGVAWRVAVAATTAERRQWLYEDKAQFYYDDLHSSNLEVSVGEGCETKAAGQMRLRIALPAFKQSFGLAAFADSGMKTIKDIKPGTTYAVPVASVTVTQFYHAFRRYLNMTEKELIMVPFASFPGAYRAFGQGQAKLVATEPASPTTLEWMSGPHGLMFFDWPADKEAEARFHEVLGTVPFVPVTMGPKEYLGIRMPVNLWCAVAKAELDAELVYRLVKWTDENYDRFKDGAPQCQTMTTEYLVALAKEHYEPLHDGAVRYLEEKGLWTPELQARQDYNIAQLTKWTDAYKTAIEMADDQGIVVNPDNKDWQTLWEGYRASLNLPLLMMGQGPGKEQPTYASYYTRWNEVKPFK